MQNDVNVLGPIAEIWGSLVLGCWVKRRWALAFRGRPSEFAVLPAGQPGRIMNVRRMVRREKRVPKAQSLGGLLCHGLQAGGSPCFGGARVAAIMTTDPVLLLQKRME